MADQIGGFLNNVFPKEHQWKMILFQNWKDIIGSLDGKVRIEKLYNNVIVLGVCHPAWAQELFLLSNVLKGKINKVLKEDRIKTIKFRTVGFYKKQKNMQHKLHHELSNIENIEFSAEEDAILDKVKNKDLRLALKRYYIRCKLFKKESFGENSKPLSLQKKSSKA